MKKYIVIFLIGSFAFSTLNLSAQSEKDTIWYDANWNKSEKNIAAYFRPQPAKKDNGYWLVDYFLSGIKQMEAFSTTLDIETFDGTVTWYYENGNKMQTVNYKNNVLTGERKNYHEGGPLKSQYSYDKDGKIGGDWVSYFENAKMDESGIYKNGERNGLWKEYHKNGKLKGEGKYANDKKVGIWKMHYYDGTASDE